MTHYEQRLEKDLVRIRQRVKALSTQVEEALKNAIHALLTGNTKLAYTTILGDNPINRLTREIDRLCHAFMALHLPSAGHLRYMSSTIRATLELERIGDYAVTICRESVQLPHPPEGTVAHEIQLMADQAKHMLHQAIVAFQEGNEEMAKATMGMADHVERTFDTVFADLITEQDKLKIKDLFALFVVFNMLERVSDQAKNICEETVFAVTGATKKPKVYAVLFLDEDNSCQSQIAETIARKLFPNSGHYASAGRRAAAAINAQLVAFMEQHGIDISKAQPKALELAPNELADYHVIVSLQGPIKSYIPQVPFHTTALEWEVEPAPTRSLTAEQATDRYAELYRTIAVQVQLLMETLSGEEAS